MRLRILPGEVFQATSEEDPLDYYYHPLTGRFYFGRLAAGLDLLKEKKYPRILEIGYGSGILLPTLAELGEELYGVDIHSYHLEIQQRLEKHGLHCRLLKAEIGSMPFENNFFDLIVIFSVLEHLKDLPRALSEAARVLKDKGEILIGIPRLDKIMEGLFILIGYFRAGQVHIRSEASIEEALKRYFNLKRQVFPRSFPYRSRLYSYYHGYKI